ncbi:N-carbamoyl-D-amino acid hydrolase [Cyphellophora attinorum]|uniref:N-carbamoyl-D-amino acid hydrolase n=1 Tax=Cyphellophora attinorum TaxID=1664694 RepID=A0A0N1HF80_9EURO|nr:N-carbamoyl-D-amino acid hydrolase [Phialophora attinorum]KPI43895.1 N-carbamoyl-D-amino acid hydrolase [Phialophora attinorum]
MSRILKVAALQLGPVHATDTKPEVIDRHIRLLRSAASQGVRLAVLPELAFTTFFARHLFPDDVSLSSYLEHDLEVAKSEFFSRLFREAGDLGIDLCVGYAERTPDGRTFNSSVYFSATTNEIIAKYRKVHIPGTREPLKDGSGAHHLEKRYFEPGDLGFEAFRAPNVGEHPGSDGRKDAIMGMLICNDRRWPEAWRCYGLQGVELILCGYNTPGYNPAFWGTTDSPDPEKAETRIMAQHKLVVQANSYMNSCFTVAAGKAGLEDGVHRLIGGSCIVSPDGDVLAEAVTEGDEVIVAEIDLDDCIPGKSKIFNFGEHRQVDKYSRIVDQVGVREPPALVASTAGT